MAQVAPPLPPMWELHIEFLDPGFIWAQLQLLGAFEKSTGRHAYILSLSLSHSLYLLPSISKKLKCLKKKNGIASKDFKL